VIDISMVVDFCRDELSIANSVIINISLDDLTEDNAHGWCTNSSDKPGFNPNEYEIELEETLTDEEMLITLCHEMVHIRQYSEGNPSNELEAEKLESVLAEKFKKCF